MIETTLCSCDDCNEKWTARRRSWPGIAQSCRGCGWEHPMKFGDLSFEFTTPAENDPEAAIGDDVGINERRQPVQVTLRQKVLQAMLPASSDDSEWHMVYTMTQNSS